MCLLLTAPANAATQGWREEKCARYAAAWRKTMTGRDMAGLSAAFLGAHDAFLASGCLSDDRACPRSPQEIDIANVMVIHSMNAGMASTFAPFACRR